VAQRTTGVPHSPLVPTCGRSARLQELDGGEEQRISLLSAESDLHPRLIRIALDYAADHADEVRERIDRNQAMAERSRRTSQQREALLA